MEFIDRILRCMDCGEDFIFTAGEQLFFSDKQFKNDPKRCKPCKAKRAVLQGRSSGAGKASTRTETRTTCSSCGKETTVPFRPTQGRPVLCRSCFQIKPTDTALPLDTPLAAAAMAEAASSMDVDSVKPAPLRLSDSAEHALAELTAVQGLGQQPESHQEPATLDTPDPIAN